MLLLNLSRYCSLCLTIAVLLPLVLAAQYATAGPGDTFNLTVGSTLMYDSNVFRLSRTIDADSLLRQSARSDQVITSTASLNLNKRYGMQHFDITGSIVDNRYQNFDFLNFIGKNYNAHWHWYLTPYFHGTLSSSHRESLNNFANLTGFINSTNRNLRTNEDHRFDAVFEINRTWHLVGGIRQSTLTNSRINVLDFDNRVRSAEGGIRYAFPSGSSLTYKTRVGTGEFINRAAPLVADLFDTRFNEMEHEIRLKWPVTGKTSIDARAGYLTREHAHFRQRDFNGFVGNFNVDWAATSKIHVQGGWAHDLLNFQTSPRFLFPGFSPFSASYGVIDRFFFAPVWQITEKTALRLRYDYSMLSLRGAVIPLASDNRSDSTHSGLIAMDWRPLNAVMVSASLVRDHRSSNLRGFDYDVTAASISATLNF